MLKTNNTLILLDLSDNEIGGYEDEKVFRATPEGPAALADGLKANLSVQQLDVSANGLGPDGAKAIATSIAENRTITSVSYQQNAFFYTFSELSFPFPLSFLG